MRNTIVVDKPAAQIVRQIFEWAAGGITVTGIAQKAECSINTDAIRIPCQYQRKI